jgi:hypothetical protein
MRNFQKLCSGLNPVPLLSQLATQGELWNQYLVRTSHPRSAHRVVDDIILRYNRYESGEDFVEKVCSEIAVVDYPAWHKLPHAQAFVFALLGQVQGVHLGRVMISRVPPGIAIPPHSDLIREAELAFPDKVPPAVYYNRYHLALASAPGSLFRCGDETVYMEPGSAWWFDNKLEHEVVNNSADDRIHLIVDIRTGHDEYTPGGDQRVLE